MNTKTKTPLIYQIYPRSFMDANGDGVGDIAGATSRLQHIADLGADMVWLSPFYPSPMKDFGYDVSDYCDIDPLFGTLKDFDALAEEARRLNLGVMTDLVLSHTSDKHPWFADSCGNGGKKDWYVWADAKSDGSPPNNWLSVFGGGAWEWHGGRKQYYLHNFLAEQPDLNFHNAEVRAALLDVARFWLQRGVCGFRLDTVNFYYHDKELRDNPAAEDAGATNLPAVNPYGMQQHLYDKTRPENTTFLEALREVCDEHGATLMGEVGAEGDGLKVVAEYTKPGRLQTAYSFDFLGGELTPEYFRDRFAAFAELGGDGTPCWAFSNHDVKRHLSRWRKDDDAREDELKLAKMCAALLLSLRGAACIYQGEELALDEADIKFEDLQDPYGIRFWPGFKGRDGCRTPMVWDAAKKHAGFSDAQKTWLPIPPSHINAAGDDSVFEFYKQMSTFRKNTPELNDGAMRVVDDGHRQVFAFWRESENGKLLAAFNFSRKEAVWSPDSQVNNFAEHAPVCEGAQCGESLRLPPLGFAFARA